MRKTHFIWGQVLPPLVASASVARIEDNLKHDDYDDDDDDNDDDDDDDDKVNDDDWCEYDGDGADNDWLPLQEPPELKWRNGD